MFSFWGQNEPLSWSERRGGNIHPVQYGEGVELTHPVVGHGQPVLTTILNQHPTCILRQMCVSRTGLITVKHPTALGQKKGSNTGIYPQRCIAGLDLAFFEHFVWKFKRRIRIRINFTNLTCIKNSPDPQHCCAVQYRRHLIFSDHNNPSLQLSTGTTNLGTKEVIRQP